jgi:hypothetical protein
VSNKAYFKPKDLTGLRIGTLTVLRFTGDKDKWGYYLWEAQCDCGNKIIRASCRFLDTYQPNRSCGCMKKGRKPISNYGAHVYSIWRGIQKSAVERGLNCELTEEQVRELIQKPCHYCGSFPPTKRLANLAGEFARHGIDRSDNSVGYIYSNCVPCCIQCNIAKMDWTVEEFREWVFRTYRHMTGEYVCLSL